MAFFQVTSGPDTFIVQSESSAAARNLMAIWNGKFRPNDFVGFDSITAANFDINQLAVGMKYIPSSGETSATVTAGNHGDFQNNLREGREWHVNADTAAGGGGAGGAGGGFTDQEKMRAAMEAARLAAEQEAARLAAMEAARLAAEEAAKGAFDPNADAETTFGPNAPLVAPDDPTYQFQQFLSGLGRRGAGTSGVAGRARLGRYAPTQARFLADLALNPRLAGQAGTFADFTAREPLYGQAANRSASDLFDQAVRLGSGLNPTGAGFDSLTELQRGFLNPSDRDAAAQLENLARAKARSQYGVAAEFFRPNVDLREQFFAQDAPTAMSFSDFLNQKIFGQAPPGQQINLGNIGTPVPGFSDDTRSQFRTFAPGMGF